MSQSEDQTVIPVANPKTASKNGKDGGQDTIEAYQTLEKKIHAQVEAIQQTLSEYYAKHFKEYFPDNQPRTLHKWAVNRIDGVSALEVYFRGKQYDDAPTVKDLVRTLGAPPPPPPTSPSTGITTYDTVGAPISGPKPPPPPPSSSINP